MPAIRGRAYHPDVHRRYRAIRDDFADKVRSYGSRASKMTRR